MVQAVVCVMGGGTGSFACLLLAGWPRFLTGHEQGTPVL